MLSSGSPTTGASGATRTGVVPPTVGPSVPPLHWGCSNGGTADRDVPAVLADDFAGGHHRLGFGILGHLDCRQPRVLSAEERTLLFIYCRDHQVAECVRCGGRLHLREVASIDSFGTRTYGCSRLLPSTATVYAECTWVLWQDYSFRHGASLLFRVRLQHEAGGRSAHRPGNQGGL